MPFTDNRFRCMGCEMRVLVEGTGDTQAAAAEAEAFLHEADRRLSRFRPDSEVSRLNDHTGETVAVSPLLMRVLVAALDSAERSVGIVVPTLLDAIEQAGYRDSLGEAEPMALRDALPMAPARTPAGPDPSGLWKQVTVDRDRGTVTRPPELRLDLTGAAKGVAADEAARLVARHAPERFLIDCSGDLAIGGSIGDPYLVAVEHPVTGEKALELPVSGGGVATSGLNRRLWLGCDGQPRHHLLDPATGAPAWTGLAGVTALGPTTAGADATAKAALLAGPTGARTILGESGGGVLLHEDGSTEQVGMPRPRIVVTLGQLQWSAA